MFKTPSDQLIRFVKAREGWASRAYQEKHDVVTIGYGFTNLDKVCSRFFLNQWGRPLRLGDTMTRVDGDILLARVLSEEYAPAVVRRFAGKRDLSQQEGDTCTSVIYNCGAGALNDRWAKALEEGRLADAAALLRRTRITAQGHTLNGLISRRAMEAELLLKGIYAIPAVVPSATHSTSFDDVEAYQRQLQILGFYPGPVDGMVRPELTNAIIKYQRSHPDLVADGIVGRATRASLTRDVAAKNSQVLAPTAGVVVAGGAVVAGMQQAAGAGPQVLLGAAALLALVVAGWFIYGRVYRKELKRLAEVK